MVVPSEALTGGPRGLVRVQRLEGEDRDLEAVLVRVEDELPAVDLLVVGALGLHGERVGGGVGSTTEPVVVVADRVVGVERQAHLVALLPRPVDHVAVGVFLRRGEDQHLSDIALRLSQLRGGALVVLGVQGLPYVVDALADGRLLVEDDRAVGFEAARGVRDAREPYVIETLDLRGEVRLALQVDELAIVGLVEAVRGELLLLPGDQVLGVVLDLDGRDVLGVDAAHLAERDAFHRGSAFNFGLALYVVAEVEERVGLAVELELAAAHVRVLLVRVLRLGVVGCLHQWLSFSEDVWAHPVGGRFTRRCRRTKECELWPLCDRQRAIDAWALMLLEP